jgi:hypothetical protein
MRSFVNRGSASHQQRTARRSSPTTHSKALMGGEQGRRAPSGAARTLLFVVAKNPRALLDVA